MGGAQYICSDKTGTLTANKMNLVAINNMTEESIKFNVIGRKKTGIDSGESEKKRYQLLMENVFWNKTNLTGIEMNEVTKEYVSKGNATEQGIFNYFMEAESVEECIAKINELKNYEVLEFVKFTSERKKSSIAVRFAEKEGQDDEVRVYCKGAPDWMIVDNEITKVPICSKMMKSDGDEDIDNEFIEKVQKEFADEAYRTIMFAYKEMSMEQFESEKENFGNKDADESSDSVVEEDEDDKMAPKKIYHWLESDLTAYSIIGIEDPLRVGIEQSVKICNDAGITVIMCTGDAPATAKAIALKAGILKKEDADNRFAVMTGKMFETETGGLREDP
jgi:magnesium-transporting ATPase (P-type)